MYESETSQQIDTSGETDLNMKRDLLQQEIVNRNYNKDLFIDFCISRKPYGDDLSRWTYEELSKVVKEYVTLHQEEDAKDLSKKQYEETIRKTTQEIQSQINQMSLPPPSENLNPSQNSSTSSPVHITNRKEIDCKKLSKSVLNDNSNIKIILRSPKAVQTSIFQSDYILYEVFTSGKDWLVFRRYNDFLWLRNTLKKIHPGYYLPPLPGKKMGNRRFESDFVEKRMKMLNLFLDDLMENENFRASECLISFLSVVDRVQFEFKMKEMNSLSGPQFVEDIPSVTGKIKLLEDENNEYFYHNISNYFKLQFQLLERMNYNLKNFYYNTVSACENLEEVHKDLDILAQLNQKVMMKEEITKTFEELGIFFKNWKRVLFNQNELIKSHIKVFFKRHSMENASFHELVEEREVKRNAYASEQNKLLAKKEKMWNNRDLNKYEITSFDGVDRFLLIKDRNYAFSKMCTEETKKVTNLYNVLCFANYNNNHELKKLINRNKVKFVNNMKDFAEKFQETLTDSLNTWSELGSSFGGN